MEGRAVKKRINSKLYTEGKYGRGFREIVDTQNPFLYSKGVYPTKITKDDLPEDYLRINSRSIWYMNGYVKTSGITDLGYLWVKENHLFKDDCIYISYGGKLEYKVDDYGWRDIAGYDLRFTGNCIVPIVLAAEKYSNYDTSAIRSEIEKKRIWLRDNEPGYYKQMVGEDRDIFTLWKERGYV